MEGGTRGLTGREMRMQVIASKDAEIEDPKQRLAALENQLTEERDNRKVAFHSP